MAAELCEARVDIRCESAHTLLVNPEQGIRTQRRVKLFERTKPPPLRRVSNKGSAFSFRS